MPSHFGFAQNFHASRDAFSPFRASRDAVALLGFALNFRASRDAVALLGFALILKPQRRLRRVTLSPKLNAHALR